MQSDPTARFADRANSYADSRPDYPKELLSLLKDEVGLTSETVIADIGSGTGILSELLLANGNYVYCVEPNREMRKMAESRLANQPGFRSVDAKAEQTTLAAQCVDLITVAQAFHWFDSRQCRREFSRILKPGGATVLLWNFRKEVGKGFVADYEELLLEFSLDYAAVRESYPTKESLRPFFGSDSFTHTTLVNNQIFDLERARQLLISSSYVPPPGHPRHEPMLAKLEEVFDRHASSGSVRMNYETCVYVGVIS